jgi:hypothetical protein
LHSRFSQFKRADLRKDYTSFRNIMMDFCSFYGLESVSFKEIDKFLWLRNGSPAAPDVLPSAAVPEAEQDA